MDLLFLLLVKAYQTFLSEQQPDVCNYSPSCSRYGEAAVKKYGLWGLLMAGDRLLRCNPGSWAHLGLDYTLKDGKLHEDMGEYYLFSKLEFSPGVRFPLGER